MCTGCTTCKTVCPAGAISGEKGKMHRIDQDLCMNCGACGRICVKEAVIDSHGIKVARIKRSQWPKPVIELAQCYSCGNCADVCPVGCITMTKPELKYNRNNQYTEYPVMTDEKACIGCGWCAETCNFDAITMAVKAAPKAEEVRAAS